jgi:hypothetical protein
VLSWLESDQNKHSRTFQNNKENEKLFESQSNVFTERHTDRNVSDIPNKNKQNHIKKTEKLSSRIIQHIDVFCGTSFIITINILLLLICIMGFIMSAIKIWANHNYQPYYSYPSIIFSLIFGLFIALSILMHFFVALARIKYIEELKTKMSDIIVSLVKGITKKEFIDIIFLLSIMLIITSIVITTVFGVYNDMKTFGPLCKTRKQFYRYSLKNSAVDEGIEPYIRSKVLILNPELIEINLQKSLPAHLMAKDPNDVGTVIMITEGATRVGYYGGFRDKIAYKPYMDATVIDWEKKVVIAKKRWEGGPPPEYAPTTAYGERPNKYLVINYIKALSKN